jgi:hypothetical protein
MKVLRKRAANIRAREAFDVVFAVEFFWIGMCSSAQTRIEAL